MKLILSLALLQMVLATTVMADPLQLSSAATVTPTVSTAAAVGCIKSTGDNQVISCLALMTVAPFSTTSLMALFFVKEEVQQVEQDAYNFLAGEEISEALKALIDSLKAENEELAQRSDKEITAAMLQVLNIQ